jgi:hypothetical protein
MVQIVVEVLVFPPFVQDFYTFHQLGSGNSLSIVNCAECKSTRSISVLSLRRTNEDFVC